MSETVKILLKQVPLFDGIPDEILSELGKAIKERRLRHGEILFSEGDPGDAFYIIKSGQIEILKNDPGSGRQISLAFRSQGDFFGEMSLLEDSPRFAAAKAMGDSVVLELARKDFENLIINTPSVAMEVLGVLSSRLRQADLQMIHDLQQKNEQLGVANKRLLETTRKLEESNKSLQSANKFMEKVISASQFFMIVTDPGGRIFIFNEAAREVFGCNFQDVAGTGIDTILIPVGNEELLAEIEAKLAEGRTWSGDVLTKTRVERRLFIELVAARVFDESGDIFASLYMGRDITEEKNVERQMTLLGLMATRGEMAAEIAHELNNYLSIVLGNLELLQMELDMGKLDKAPKKIDSMKIGLDKITHFTDGLMMYSRPEMKKEPFDLHAFLENELFFIKPQNRFKTVEFVCDFDSKLTYITADKSQIQQALLNLLNNAADATAEKPLGERRITIKTLYLPNEKAVRITVTDNGHGLSQDCLNRVFKQHFTTKERGHGFGLLAIKRVIKNHAGRVWAENHPGGGAAFNMQFPIKPEEKTALVAAAPSACD